MPTMWGQIMYECVTERLYITNQSINQIFDVLGTNWGPTGKSSVQRIHTDKISFLYAKQSLRNRNVHALDLYPHGHTHPAMSCCYHALLSCNRCYPSCQLNTLPALMQVEAIVPSALGGYEAKVIICIAKGCQMLMEKK